MDEILEKLREPVDILLREGNTTAVAQLLAAYAHDAAQARREDGCDQVLVEVTVQ
jgi:hypothetical protein